MTKTTLDHKYSTGQEWVDGKMFRRWMNTFCLISHFWFGNFYLGSSRKDLPLIRIIFLLKIASLWQQKCLNHNLQLTESHNITHMEFRHPRSPSFYKPLKRPYLTRDYKKNTHKQTWLAKYASQGIIPFAILNVTIY